MQEFTVTKDEYIELLSYRAKADTLELKLEHAANQLETTHDHIALLNKLNTSKSERIAHEKVKYKRLEAYLDETIRNIFNQTQKCSIPTLY